MQYVPEMQVDEADQMQDGITDAPDLTLPSQELDGNEFGPWLKPKRRHTITRGRGGGHGVS